MICIQLQIKCKIILLKILENGLNKSYFMTYHKSKQLSSQSSVQFALILEAIWRFQNDRVHLNKLENPFMAAKALDFRITEHWLTLFADAKAVTSKEMFWSPPTSCIKINIDATVFPSYTLIAAVARNDVGHLIKAWAMPHDIYLPLMAEDAAIQWVIQLDKAENWNKIIVESDSKVCIDALVSDQPVCDWCISVLCDNVKLLAVDFNSNFCWVKREANLATHMLAKLVPSPSCPVLYFPNDLPTLLEMAWFRDFSCIPFGV